MHHNERIFILDHLEYFNDVNAQKQIDKLAKKYKNKRLVIYGAGIYFQLLMNNFDLSKLNIVGIADKKFEYNKDSNNTPYIALSPEELNEVNYDVILVAVYNHIQIIEFLKFRLLINGKNHNKRICQFIKPTLTYFFKTFLH